MIHITNDITYNINKTMYILNIQLKLIFSQIKNKTIKTHGSVGTHDEITQDDAFPCNLKYQSLNMISPGYAPLSMN